MVDPKRKALAGSRTSSFRFSRASSAFALSAVERPPIILEWNSGVLRVGHAQQHRPQHLIPWSDDSNNKTLRSEEDWYFIIAPLLNIIWNRLMLDPAKQRVVCVAPSWIRSKAWEASMKQALWNLGVPAVYFISCLETVPYSMGWKRGLVVHVGKQQAQLLILADGASLYDTFQAVPCGYDTVVTRDGNVPVEWTDSMNTHWLDESNPNSLMMALLKCLSACPTDLKRDVISNLVFVGDTVVLVPDLSRQVRDRLIAVLNKSAETFDEEPVSDLTVVPIECGALSVLASSVSVTTTAPLRPDLVSWVGGGIWATLWHRHYDADDNQNVKWSFAPENESSLRK